MGHLARRSAPLSPRRSLLLAPRASEHLRPLSREPRHFLDKGLKVAKLRRAVCSPLRRIPKKGLKQVSLIQLEKPERFEPLRHASDGALDVSPRRRLVRACPPRERRTPELVCCYLHRLGKVERREELRARDVHGERAKRKLLLGKSAPLVAENEGDIPARALYGAAREGLGVQRKVLAPLAAASRKSRRKRAVRKGIGKTGVAHRSLVQIGGVDGHGPHTLLVIGRAGCQYEPGQSHGFHGAADGADVARLFGTTEDDNVAGKIGLGHGILLAGGNARRYSSQRMSMPQDRAPPRADERLPLLGRRALVVGGSGGIGAALAAALAARGADLVIHGGSSAQRLARALESARGAAARARAVAAQVSAMDSPAPASIEGFLLPLERPAEFLGRLPELGPIDLLAVAFGPFVQKPLAATTLADWERLALLDLALPGALASALLPSMCERGYGRVILFGGTRTDAIRAYATNAAYAAAKTGLAVLAKSLAAEGAERNVAAFLLCPGFVDTEYLSEGLRAELRGKAPRGRLVRPEEIGSFAADLAAADPCVASGALITLDGGLRL